MERKASLHKFSPQHSEISRTFWCQPAHGRSKINVDASIQSSGLVFKIGMVIRNERGQFVKGKTMCFKESVSILEVEARGVQLAIDWTEELGLQQVDIENDAKVVVKAVKNEAHYYSEVGHILDYWIIED